MLKPVISRKLFARASRILPGGVDSPVRAFKSVGGSPLFISRASGATIQDVDGNTYIDYVMSWGPLIHGHAPLRSHQSHRRGRAARDELRRALRSRARAGRTRSRAHAVGRAGAVRELGHGSGDERRAGGSRLHAARQDHEVRGLLSRPRRSVPGQGRVGSDDARYSHQSRRPGGRDRRHAAGALQRPRLGGHAAREHMDGQSPPSWSSPLRATWAWSRPPMGSWRASASAARATESSSCSTRSFPGSAPRPGGAQTLLDVRPDLTCLGKIIGGGLPVGAYGGRADVMDAGGASRTCLSGGNALGQSAWP